MAKEYTIRHGFSFVGADQIVRVGGEKIELDDDVAANHAHKLEAVDADTAADDSAASAKTKGGKQAADPATPDQAAS